jgi:hypothetical protein
MIVVRWVADSGAHRTIAQPVLDYLIVLVHTLLPVSMISLIWIAAGKRRGRNNGDKSDFDTPRSAAHGQRIAMIMIPAKPSSMAENLIAAATLPLSICFL